VIDTTERRDTKPGQPADSSVASRVRARLARERGSVALAVVAAAVVFGFPAMQPDNELMYLAISVVIFAVAASGLDLLYGDCGQMSVAHGGIVGLGAYATIVSIQHGVPVLLCLAVSIAVGGVIAVVVGTPSLRLQGHYFAITTFAAAAALSVAVGNIAWLGGQAGESLPPTSTTLRSDSSIYYVSTAALAVVVVLLGLVRRSNFGHHLRAIRENELLARAVGVRTKRLKITAFAVSGGICGLAGFLFAFANVYVSPDAVGSQPGIALVLIVILGGSGYWVGPIVGSTIYYALPYVFPLSASANQLAIGGLLIVVVLTLPRGVSGTGATLTRRAMRRLRPQTRFP
jgi:branched-chain amino acid transport system permease protein